MYWIHDLEYDLMDYCIKHRGKWWANHFFRNIEVNNLYHYLRKFDPGTVIAIVSRGDSDYQRHIDFYNKKVKPIIDKAHT